jgi:DNA-binding response OmpR family regulator
MRNKILLVEDSKVIQQMYKNKLTIEQFKVITADNGMEAIKILSQEKPDIILLDLMMPIMDGYKGTPGYKNRSETLKHTGISFFCKGSA